MRPRLAVIIPVVFFALVVEVVTQTCPPCYKDRGHMVARNGFGVDGRQIVNIALTGQRCRTSLSLVGQL